MSSGVRDGHDFSDRADKARHDGMVGMMEQMLTARKELASALTGRETDYRQRRCEGLDRQMDALVEGAGAEGGVRV